ncbi:alginate lyase family protein [Sphingobacterium sp. DR205]|uniref:alginate lyase family protein n=1 Tax=Sphingobacterium sp. DR205 TaxID=2713573 RepID=UPI0013E440CA|nr:alginate lyase family protein [Sphingobacterium sp. DR205]QIH35373.1 alginate lyase family protein [Sphingobacterium sp. DR205]
MQNFIYLFFGLQVRTTQFLKLGLTLLLAGLFIRPTHGHAQSLMHPITQIHDVKSQISKKSEPVYTAYKQLIILADSLLLADHHAVEDFSVPGFYSDKEGQRAMAKKLHADAFAAYCTALAYTLNGEEKYASKALYFINSWATINKKYSDFDGPVVLSYAGAGLMIAAELLKNDPLWTKNDRDHFKTWTMNVYQKATHFLRERPNNIADWARFANLLSANFLDDQKELSFTIALIKTDLFEKIAADGHLIEEVKRGEKGLWYTYFSLAPLTAAMWCIHNATGENLFAATKDGKSIKRAIDYLYYYNQHPTAWPWFKNPDVDIQDRTVGVWPSNLFEAMKDIYHTPEFDSYLSIYRPVVYKKNHFAWTFPTLMPAHLRPDSTTK